MNSYYYIILYLYASQLLWLDFQYYFDLHCPWVTITIAADRITRAGEKTAIFIKVPRLVSTVEILSGNVHASFYAANNIDQIYGF